MVEHAERRREPAEVRSQRLISLIRGEPIVKRPEKRPNEVLSWPDFVVIEFVAAALFFVLLFVLSWYVNAPLEAHSNPDVTPNPSKAPWYFLNLQELLLHMHPSLAGVLVPGALIFLLMTIPYVDSKSEGVGLWFTSPLGVQIALFTIPYTLVLLAGLILFDEYVVTRSIQPVLTGIGVPLDLAKAVVEIFIPVGLMLVLPAILVLLVKRFFRADTRHCLIALFTGFVVTYAVLTIIGTAFRGPGMHLYWPWLHPPRLE